MQNQDMDLVLSTDAKPRLKWTPELHQRFVDATVQLGGTDKATPKSLMRVMGIPGLTLYHLKSHLQKYRLGKNHPIETFNDSTNQEDCKEDTESLHVARAIQVQVEVQKKLYEQIEVQRHLQLRIEAQGKYLQEVLKKAQETLAAYTSSSSMGGEHTKAELSQLVSIINSGCPSPSLSELTEARALSLESLDNEIRIKRHGCSTESSLTSSENSHKDEDCNNLSQTRVTLPLLEQPLITGLNDQLLGKRKGIFIGDGEPSNGKKAPTQREKMGHELSNVGIFGTLDLNRQYKDDKELAQPTIDLNSIGVEQFHGAS